jgi:hypothetical protein
MADFFSTLFGGGAEKEAADANRALLAQYGPQAQGYLTSGYDTGVTNLNQAIGAYAPLSDLASKYGKGTDLYLGALGVNGPDAARAAQSQFVTTPGYDLSERAGEDAISRMRANSGMYLSGNTLQDLQTFGQNNLYQTQYAPWLQGLSGINQNALTATAGAAAGQAAGYGSLANLAQQYAQNQTGVAGNVLSGNVNANDLQAAGEAAGAKNLLGAGLSLATLGMGGFGSGGFANSLFGGGLGNALGGSYGGSAANPLPGLSASDYGPGAGWRSTYGLA